MNNEQLGSKDQMVEERAPVVHSVLHLTDFSIESEIAFAHALAIATLRKADLTILHVGKQNFSGDDWQQFPSAEIILKRWGLLEEDSIPMDIEKHFGFKIQRVDLTHDNVAQASIGYLKSHPNDVLVLSTEGRSGPSKWLKPSIAEKLSNKLRSKTLFIPHKADPFIDLDSGKITINRILVPVDHFPSPHEVVEYAVRAATMTAQKSVEIILLHISDGRGFPQLDLPKHSNIQWTKIERKGSVVDKIIKTADQESVDLIIMATRGTNGILDALRGSVTRQVLSQARCPVYSVPST